MYNSHSCVKTKVLTESLNDQASLILTKKVRFDKDMKYCTCLLSICTPDSRNRAIIRRNEST